MARKTIEIPVWEKVNITLAEAAALFSIGEKKKKKKTDEPNCNFVIFKGSHRLIKRKKFEEYIDSISTW